MNKPTIFIGSSSEGLPIAYAIQENLETLGAVYVWTQGVFELGSSYLESLIKELDKADFAILVLTEDDITISRDKESVSPRDNVLFELGLFIGRLGSNRAFFVYNTEKNIKLPSDLLGISGAGYKLQQPDNIVASLGATCNKIRTAVNKTGLRPKLNITQVNAINSRLEFSNKVTGYWWERIKPDEKVALSFLTIEYDEEQLTLKIQGLAFSNSGEHVANWRSISSDIRFDEEKVFYSWEGWHPSSPSSPYEGWGEMQFSGSGDVYRTGNGLFSKLTITDLKTTVKSSFELSRCTKEEVDIMDSKNRGTIGKLIVDKISQMF